MLSCASVLCSFLFLSSIPSCGHIFPVDKLFQVLTIVSGAALNIVFIEHFVYKSSCVFIVSRVVSRSGIAGSLGSCSHLVLISRVL